MRRSSQMPQQQKPFSTKGSGQSNPQQQQQLQTKGSSAQKPQYQPKLNYQQSKQIQAIGQKKPQQQSQQRVADSGTRINIFDFQQFILIMQQGLQQQKDYYVNSEQQLLNQYKCMIVNHNNKTIEGICVNKKCMAFNRRTCFDCIIQKLHDKDINEQNQQCIQPLNADQLNNVIKNYKLFHNKLIDFFEYNFYFEQLELTNENNYKIACIKLQELDKLENSLKYLQEIKAQISIKGYLEQQYNINMGIFDYFLQYYKEIIQIKQNIENYTILKKYARKCNKYNNKVIINITDVEALNKLKQKKQIIIHKIIETSQYKNQEITENDQNFIKAQIIEICELGLVFLKQKQYELAIECFVVQTKSNPNDPQNNFSIGICFHELQKYKDAIHFYDKAIQFNPQDSGYYFNKGQIYNMNKDVPYLIYLDMRKPFNVMKRRQNSDYYYYKGCSLSNLSRYEEAIQCYDKAIRLNPQNSGYYNDKGNSLVNLKRYEEAEIMFYKLKQLQQA